MQVLKFPELEIHTFDAPGDKDHARFVTENYQQLMAESRKFENTLRRQGVKFDYDFFINSSKWTADPHDKDIRKFWRRAFLWDYLVARYEANIL
jgi:hypothetical protein